LLSTFCFSKSYSTIADAAHPFVTLFVTILRRAYGNMRAWLIYSTPHRFTFQRMMHGLYGP
jgi:hypothetical protein